jgi:hypothetical protein
VGDLAGAEKHVEALRRLCPQSCEQLVDLEREVAENPEEGALTTPSAPISGASSAPPPARWPSRRLTTMETRRNPVTAWLERLRGGSARWRSKCLSPEEYAEARALESRPMRDFWRWLAQFAVSSCSFGLIAMSVWPQLGIARRDALLGDRLRLLLMAVARRGTAGASTRASPPGRCSGFFLALLVAARPAASRSATSTWAGRSPGRSGEGRARRRDRRAGSGWRSPASSSASRTCACARRT